jgi:hypothetical protein
VAISKALRFQVLTRDGHTCQSCGRTAPEVKLEVDHVVPEALGGRTVAENLQALCVDCNGGKSATPPNAARVAAVAADAARWAEAQKLAAENLLSNRDARNEAHRQFLERWASWEDRRNEEMPFEPGWQRSVDNWIGAGLPLPVLLDVVDRAMRSNRVAAEARFRYMCKIAWGYVADLRDATAAIAHGSKKPAASPSTAADSTAIKDFADTILRCLTGHEDPYNEALQVAIEHIEAAKLDPDDDLSDADPLLYAVELKAMEMCSDNIRVSRALDLIFENLPEGKLDQYRAEALKRAHVWEDSPDEIDVKDEIAWVFAVDLAQAYLGTLPEEERAEWLSAGHAINNNVNPLDALAALRAAGYARAVKAEQWYPLARNMCKGPGRHNAACRNRTAFKVWYGNCRLEPCRTATEACIGHADWCTAHLEQAMETGLRWTDGGEFVEVADYDEIKPDDAWSF